MNIQLGDLPTGSWRNLTTKELQGLQDAVSKSDNAPQAKRTDRTQGRRRRGRD